MQGWSSERLEATTLDALAQHNKDEHSHRFTLLTKHIVRPSVAKPFVEEWLKVGCSLCVTGACQCGGKLSAE